jgi:hypothetical protein
VLGNGAAQDHEIPGAGTRGGDLLAVRHHSHAARRDETPVGLASINHLGVTGNQEDSCPLGGHAHRFHDAAELRERKPLLENESRAQIQGPGSRHGEVVDRSIDREHPNVPAREEERSHHVSVGREGQSLARDLEDGLIVQALEI